MKTVKLGFAAVAIISLFNYNAWATHIRAGEITATLINCSGFTYRITITGYTDTGSPVQFGGGAMTFGDGERIDFIEGSSDFKLKQELGDELAVTVFEVDHTYPGPGEYTITFFERNRNAGVVNMSNSVGTPFYIETTIVIDPILGCNNTPVMEIPPVDKACVGTSFIHNPGAYDPDGDSLSYRLVVNKKELNMPVDNYRYPNDPSFGGTTQDGDGQPTFSIDNEGNLVWDAPGMAGEYNLAFIVDEWRQLEEGVWAKMGSMTRDMQVIVDEECTNEKPELIVPADTCVEAGTNLEEVIVGLDPDGDPVMIEAFGEPFSQAVNAASFTPDPEFRPVPDSVDFRWQTSCEHIREHPYKVTFKISDNPTQGVPLADFEVWNIFIVGPKPTGLSVSALPGRMTQLDWDDYQCDNAIGMQVWRRVDSYPFMADNCVTGIPPNAGYELVGEVDVSENSFVDDNGGLGLSPGANYCYRLVAVFEDSVESYASDEVCATITGDGPIITNVSVEQTGDGNGEILVRWIPPLSIDSALFPPPFTYEVVRTSGAGASDRTVVTTEKVSETEFLDQGLDTEGTVYNYMVYLYDAADNLVDSSAIASSVRLTLAPLVGAIELSWDAETPWSIQTPEYPWHYIYRDNVNGEPGDLELIDSVNVLQDGLQYVDNGNSTTGEPLSEDTEYCYYVSTQGSYGNDSIPEPLINLSQIDCARPNDTIPPCQPLAASFTEFNDVEDCEAFMRDKPCGFSDFSNRISWTADGEGACDLDIQNYRIYYSRTGEEDTYERIGVTSDTFYLHQNLPSFAGCYRISAVDRSGNESELTEPICRDNCPQYELPNVFTPNDDLSNDSFAAFNDDADRNCPRFIESVHFQVFNRWGVEVYDSEEDDDHERSILINWDGKSASGEQLAAGVYYYLATVTYTSLNPESSTYEIKGWVHLLR